MESGLRLQMRILLVPILSILSVSCSTSQDPVNFSELVTRGGVTFEKFSDVPFTGTTTGAAEGKMQDGLWSGKVSFYGPNNMLHREVTYREGIKDGQFVGWCKNGNKRVEVEFKNNQKTGWYEENYCEGAPRIRTNFREDVIIEDSVETYFINGKSERYFPLLNGQTNGVAFWYRKDGSIRNQVAVEQGQLAGDCIEYDKDGMLIEKLTFEEDVLIEWKRGSEDNPNPFSKLAMPLNNSPEQKALETRCLAYKTPNIGRHIETLDPFAGYEINIVE
jgi:antitoxin component YwqK of YwqJK toxin-antitoxin module